jgi:hypothetical protein
MQIHRFIFSHPKETTFVLIVVFSCSLFHFMTVNPLELMPALALKSNVQCPSCGYKLNPITDQTKHASKLTPKITEEMIADEEGVSISIPNMKYVSVILFLVAVDSLVY